MATPSGTGGSPTAVHSSSPHASTWALRSPAGDQEARISSWAVAGSSAIPPKLSELTQVTLPGRRGVLRPVGLECLGQPAPTDSGEHRVADQLGVDLGASVGDTTEGAAPGVVAGRVVEYDDAARPDVLAFDRDVRRQGGGERCDPLGCRHLLDEELGRGTSRLSSESPRDETPAEPSVARCGVARVPPCLQVRPTG